jgi:uncharacterized protein (DUF488 family)
LRLPLGTKLFAVGESMGGFLTEFDSSMPENVDFNKGNAMQARPILYTVGTDLRSVEDFIEIIQAYEIRAVLDVRSYPKSKLAHFNRQPFSALLETNGVEYHFLGKELGGLRKGGYTAYIITEEFREGIRKVEAIAREKTSAVVCAERFPWKCHRKWISLELQKQGWDVRHIIDKGKVWIPK